jgi:hypothetical protein
VIIPDFVTSLGAYAFKGCTRLSSVTIGNSVASIGKKAFAGCSSLSSVTIPDSVTSIGENAFQDTALICLPAPHLDYEDLYPSPDPSAAPGSILEICPDSKRPLKKLKKIVTTLAVAVAAIVVYSKLARQPPDLPPPWSHPAAAPPLA